MVNGTNVKLNPVNINNKVIFLLALNFLNSDMWQVKWHCLSISQWRIHQQQCKSPLVHPVVNQKNSIFLQLLYVWCFHFAEEKEYMLYQCSPWHLANYLGSMPSCSFSLSLQHKNLAHLLPLFSILLWKESILTYKCDVHTRNSLLQMNPLSAFMITWKQQ